MIREEESINSVILVNKRSRLEIYLDVLKVIANGTSKATRIMYNSNLSWKPLKETLEFLTKQGLIEVKKHRRSKRYYITSKGLRVLEYFKKLQELLSPPSLNRRE